MIEVEVKLAIGSAEPEVRRLEQLGGIMVHGRSLEDNILLDLAGDVLRARGAMLRIRKYGEGATLTYKEPAPGPSGFKVRQELEAALQDPDLIVRILESAGFRRVWRYMKYRTVFRVGGLTADLDETPIGNFVELEGARESIDVLALRLGRTPAEYIGLSYRALQEQWCRKRGLAAGDMIFEQGLKS